MKIEGVAAKSLVLISVFFFLALFFAFLREPISQVDNWLLLLFHEGHVTRGKSVEGTGAVAATQQPKAKVENLKSTVAPVKSVQNQPVATGATTMSKEFKGVPTLSLKLPGEASLKDNSFIVDWAIIGPMRFSKHPQRKDDFCFMESIDIAVVDDEDKLDGTQALSYAKWHNVSSTLTDGKVNFIPLFPNVEFAVIYAVARIDSPEELKDVVIKIGSDDYAKIWVNGEVVLKYNEKCRGAFPDNNTSERFTLKKGINVIVFKCVQISGGWELFARLVDSNGKSLKLGVTPSFSK